jgi:hypothetical protein
MLAEDDDAASGAHLAWPEHATDYERMAKWDRASQWRVLDVLETSTRIAARVARRDKLARMKPMAATEHDDGNFLGSARWLATTGALREKVGMRPGRRRSRAGPQQLLIKKRPPRTSARPAPSPT